MKTRRRNWCSTNLILKIIGLLCFQFILSNCNNNPANPPIDDSPKNIGELDTTFIINPSDPIIPLSLGSYWIYVDSSFNESGLTVSFDTVTINATTIINGKTWFVVSGSTFPNYVRSSNDTLFELQPSMLPNQYVSSNWLIPATLDTSEYFILIGGDVLSFRYCIRKDSVYKIGKTSFSQYSKHWEKSDSRNYSIIVANGIGIIERELIFNTPTPIRYKRSLLSFKIIR